MTSKTRHAGVVGSILTAGWLAAAVGAHAEEPVAAGKSAAIKACSKCHVIGDYNRLGGIGSTPSFWIMARKPKSYVPRLLTFRERRPHRSMKFDVTKHDIDNIIAYIKQLKQPIRPKKR